MANPTYRLVSAVVGGALLLGACTVKKQDTPSLTGPSELSTSITVSVSPDVLNQDGASQSLVTITARDANGQPLRSLSLRAEITVEGIITDFGTLSARNVVTDTNGRATLLYTAPPAPVFSFDTNTRVEIRVTPAGTDFGNATARFATIRLVPTGVIGPGASPLRPDFPVPGATVGNATVFSATVLDANGADASAQVVSFVWTFGDGDTASGRTVTHTFDSPGSFPVSLTITDTLGRTQRVTHTVTTLQGTVPSVTDILVSPSPQIVDQTINFTAVTTVEPGHTITDYSWTFGDGSTGSGRVVTHAYHDPGGYTVTLQVTDDAGRTSTLFNKLITVTNGNPTADFTFNPSAPRSGQQVTFDASASQAAPGRTIVSYSWSFGNGASGTGQTVTTTFTTGATPTTFNVLLTVTDSAGKTSSITKPITVNP